LQAGQSIRLQVVDFESFDNDGAFSGDLDLYLFDQNLDQVDFSIEVTEFEQITVPETAEYFILVDAFSGASKYVLSISDSAATTGAPARSLNFVPNQAIVQLAEESSSAKGGMAASIKLSADTTARPVLADFRDTVAAASANLSPFEQELASRNPESLAKLQTLKQIKQLNNSPGVAIAEPNYIRTSQLAPNDEFYGLQWHYPAMNLPQAWDITTGTPATGSVIVAVVDTGVFLAHPDLANKLVPGYDFISDVSTSRDGDGIDPNPDDPGDAAVPGSSSWHGTHVAGTVAADTDNDIGVAGVSWGAEIMPLRVLGRSGQGTDFDILQAVLFAAGLPNDSGTLPAQRADIINLSLGGPGQSATAASVYQQVIDAGVIVVAAAGNESTSSPSFPAAYDGVISVAALDANDELAPYSNFGNTLDLAAPGGNVAADLTGDGQPDGVLSTIVDDSSGERQATLSFYQGTSMAAPHAAGVLALMKAVYPDLSPADVDTLLQTGAITRDAGDPGFDNSFGWGILDALLAVQAAQALANGGTLPEQPPAIVASPSAVNLSTLTTALVTLENRGGGTPVFISVDSGAPWLSITGESVDAAGLGSYRLDVDRTDLEDGFYNAIATFTFSDAITLSLSVSMQVGNAQTDGVVSELYILLVDADNDTPVSQVRVTPTAGVESSFTFEDVADGTYFIFAGSDIDNDIFICQFGEACGSYPSVNDPLTIEVNGASQTNLNFVVDILNGLTSFSTSSTDDPTLTTEGIRRKASSTKERALPGTLTKAKNRE
jgi:serine protease